MLPSEVMQTLPKTKFHPPLPNREIISRSDLSIWLQKELPVSRVALLSAPAGYGKTTLLTTLPDVLPDYYLTWLTLDKEDNDLIRFLSGLGEALFSIDPQLKQVIETQIGVSTGLISGGATIFPLRQTFALLINTMINLSLPPCILVLDDLHEIVNPAIYDGLNYLIDNQPPQIHLAISTRHDPPLRLNRLRARRQLAELNMSDLRFDLEESQRFINELLQLGLSDTDLTSLYKKTEGWPVGLVLLTNRLRSLPPPQDRKRFLQKLDHIDPNTFHYLADEVLSQEPDYLRAFLLETSILSELTPSLCQALTGRSDSASVLTELYNRNLFLTLVRGSTPCEEPVYRYHALFADFLRTEMENLDSQRLRALYTQAAKIEKVPGRVIGHLLAAQDWEAAAVQIETYGEQFLQQGLQETVANWITSIPGEIANRRYRLMYLCGLSGLLTGDLENARISLERSLHLLETEQDCLIRGQVQIGLASLAFIRADFITCAELLHQAEPFIVGVRERIDLLMLRASLSAFCESDWEQAMLDLSEAIKLVKSTEDARMWFLISLYLAPEFTARREILELIERFCEEASPRYDTQISPLRLGIEDTWASIHLRRGRLQQAIETGRDALLIKEQLGGYPFLGLNASLTVAAVYTGLGNYSLADSYLNRAIAQVEESELNRALTGSGLYPLGKLRWLQGQIDEVRRIYQEMANLQHCLPLVNTLQKMLGGLIEISAKHYSLAETQLLEAVALQSKEGISEIYSSARLLLAYLYYRWEKPQEALKQMETVMARCEQYQTPGFILQDMPLAAPLLRLAVKKGVRPRQAIALLEQMGLALEEEDDSERLLTARQLEILRLIATGYSNQAIADELMLSLATVKSHVVHIMDRLGVSSRMEAVAQARQMGLL